MKIYTYIKIDIATGRTLESGSFEYNGPVALCKGGGSPPPPAEPSAEEKALVAQQTELIALQVAQLEKENTLIETMWPDIEAYYAGELELAQLNLESAKSLLPLQTTLAEQGIDLNALQMEAITSEVERNTALEPVLLGAMGYEKDDAGNYVAVEGEVDPILSQLEERYTSALEGKEPLSPAMESDLAKEKEKLEADLSKQLGPDWKNTTSGIQAMNEFQTRADIIREEARQGVVSQAGSQYFAARGLLAGEKQQEISNIGTLMGGTSGLTGVPTGTGGGASSGTSLGGLMGGGSTSSVSGNISNLVNYYANQRAQTDQSQQNAWALSQGQSAGKSKAAMGGLMAGAQIGTMIAPGVGTAIGAGAGLLAGYLLS